MKNIKPKSEGEARSQKQLPYHWYYEVEIIKECDRSPHKIGDKIKVRQYGSFGTWDENGEWVDFWCSRIIKRLG